MLVDRAQGIIQVTEAIGKQTCGGDLERFRDDFTHPLENERRRQIAGIAAAHSIGHRKYQVLAGKRMNANWRQGLGPVYAGGEGDERIVVAGLARPAVRAGGPMEDRGGGHGGICQGVMVGGGGRISASSKSITQKQPSLSE